MYIKSTPAGATVTITNRNGVQVYKGTSPATVTLKSGSGFFKKESYHVRFELEGFAVREIPVECKVNGWYWGNLLIGGVIGMLIIDPATGAMYKFTTSDVWETLDAKAAISAPSGSSLSVYNINDIPKDQQKNLVKLN